jgi:hypothetical protein
VPPVNPEPTVPPIPPPVPPVVSLDPAQPEPAASLSPETLKAISARLNTMSEQMADAQRREGMFLTVGKAVAAAWVGYAIYALRAGSLLGSFLSIMPVWRSLDPLPVIEASEAKLHRDRRRRKAKANSKSKSKSGKDGSGGPDEQDLGAVVS